MQAADIDEAVGMLEAVVGRAITESDPHGIFAALYLQMTRRVQAGVREGLFDDGPRMDRFDTLFAKRYFAALARRRAGQEASRSWQVAFDATHEQDNIAIQHMLLGVNAHINFDLPFAAALTAPDDITALQDDFERINDLISVLLDEAQEVLNASSRGMRLIDLLGGDIDEWLASFSLGRMRTHAWEEALALAALPAERWPHAERRADRRVASLGRLLTRPPRSLQSLIDLIRLGERGRTARIIEGLRDINIQNLTA